MQEHERCVFLFFPDRIHGIPVDVRVDRVGPCFRYVDQSVFQSEQFQQRLETGHAAPFVSDYVERLIEND